MVSIQPRMLNVSGIGISGKRRRANVVQSHLLLGWGAFVDNFTPLLSATSFHFGFARGRAVCGNRNIDYMPSGSRLSSG